MESRYDAQAVEASWQRTWEEEGLYRAGAGARRSDTYVICVPPPNVTGELHMGHALNGSMQDALIRWHRMRGFDTLWQPGYDHAGISTQNVVEKQLLAEGTSRRELGRDAFVERTWAWLEQTGRKLRERRLAAPVRADERHDLAAPNLQIVAGHGDAVAVGERDAREPADDLAPVGLVVRRRLVPQIGRTVEREPAERLVAPRVQNDPPRLEEQDAVGAVEHTRGPLLGALADAVYASATLTLDPGDLLIFYTDGLVEHREHTIEEGLAPIIARLNSISSAGRNVVSCSMIRWMTRSPMASLMLDNSLRP